MSSRRPYHWTGTPVIVLRTARFHVADPIEHQMRLAFRTVDVRDVVDAHVLALNAPITGFAVFNVCSARVFAKSDSEELTHAADSVVERHFPGAAAKLGMVGARFPKSIDRVYVSHAAGQALGYTPRHTFARFLANL
jgi:UDP-glucose 4-epimerase